MKIILINVRSQTFIKKERQFNRRMDISPNYTKDNKKRPKGRLLSFVIVLSHNFICEHGSRRCTRKRCAEMTGVGNFDEYIAHINKTP